MNFQTRLADYEESAQEQMEAAQQWATEMIEERPVAVCMGAFAAGFAIGAGVAAVLCAQSSSGSGRNWRSGLSNMDLEGISDRVSEAIAAAVPKKFKHLWQ